MVDVIKAEPTTGCSYCKGLAKDRQFMFLNVPNKDCVICDLCVIQLMENLSQITLLTQVSSDKKSAN